MNLCKQITMVEEDDYFHPFKLCPHAHILQYKKMSEQPFFNSLSAELLGLRKNKALWTQQLEPSAYFNFVHSLNL